MYFPPGCSLSGITLGEDESATDPLDSCQTCSCRQGSLTCLSVDCPPVSCANPARENCCPTCDRCEYRGRSFDDGAIIKGVDR